MNYKEFAAKIKSKYPDYADMSDLELAQKMVSKFPNDYNDVDFRDAPNDNAPSVSSTLQNAGEVAAALTPGGGVIQAIKDAPALARGLLRRPESADAGIRDKIANSVGRGAPVGVGASIGAASLPVTAPALAIAGAAGLGGAAGEAYGQLGARATGGEAPQSSQDAAMSILKEGGKVGLSELAVVSGLRLGQKVVASLSQGLGQASPRAMTRVLERYHESPVIQESLGVGPAGKADIERKAIASLSKIQDGAERVYTMKGKAVENALNGLVKTTQNQPIADVSDAISSAEEFLKQPGVDATKGVGKEVRSLLDDLIQTSNRTDTTLGASGGSKLTVKELIDFRRRVDRLGDFARRSLQDADRDVGSAVARDLGASLRESVADVANKTGNTQLLKANSDFSNYVHVYNELGDFYGSKGKNIRDMQNAIERISRDFGGGGMKQEALISAKNQIPHVGNEIDKLLDIIAVRGFTADPRYTPSSNVRSIVRQLASPQRLGKTIQILKDAESAAQGPIAGQVH